MFESVAATVLPAPLAAPSNSDLVNEPVMKSAKMKQDLCQYLPPELIMNILPRLPIGSVIRCKCVCKSWRNLIESCEFGKSHFCNSKSVPGLVFFEGCSNQYHFYKHVDEPSPERHFSLTGHHFSIALKFSLPTHLKHLHIRDSSVNGLLLFSDRRIRPHNYFICNPLTRDYIKLPSSSHEHHYEPGIGFGFGVSKMRGEYKIVSVSETMCEVYTLGTGSWRSVAPCCYDRKTWFEHKTTATFLNGNLHWLLHDSYSSSYATVLGISCFDLETEIFTIFSPPPPPPHVDGCFSAISALEECLAFSHNAGGSLVIWLMNEYGDDKSWTRKFIITQASGFPIKVFKDGDILISQIGYSWLFFYKTKTIEIHDLPFLLRRAVSYSPSFLPLKTFSTENVSSF